MEIPLFHFFWQSLQSVHKSCLTVGMERPVSPCRNLSYQIQLMIRVFQIYYLFLFKGGIWSNRQRLFCFGTVIAKLASSISLTAIPINRSDLWMRLSQLSVPSYQSSNNERKLCDLDAICLHRLNIRCTRVCAHDWFPVPVSKQTCSNCQRERGTFNSDQCSRIYSTLTITPSIKPTQ